jgi:hypothetical protein
VAKPRRLPSTRRAVSEEMAPAWVALLTLAYLTIALTG